MGKKIIGFLLVIGLMIGTSGCTSSSDKEPLTRTDIVMGTPVTISIYEGGSEDILQKSFDKISQIESLLSINKSGTEIDKLNENAGIKKIKLSDTSYKIIKRAVKYSHLSDGGYDISVGPLVKLWSIGLPEAKVPTQKEIDEVIKLVDYHNIELNDSTQEGYLKKKGMILDLGSIAKGYAADEVASLLKKEGVTRAIVNLGGNIYAVGSKNDNEDWNVGIQNPFSDRGEVVGTIHISNKSIVTSGIYERFIEKDGKKYHHILNPKTGYPFETEIAGVSIISKESIDCDALSTLVFTKGLDEGLKFVEGIKDVDAVFVTKDKKVYITNGIKDNFKITNKEFILSN